MRSALLLPVFDELSDARVVADLAAEGEAAGWHGVGLGGDGSRVLRQGPVEG